MSLRDNQPFASCVRTLRRLQAAFEKLDDQSDEQTLVMLHLRRPVTDYSVVLDNSLFSRLDPTHTNRYEKMSWKECQLRRAVGSWHIQDDHPLLPGCERWYHFYGEMSDYDRVKEISGDIAQSIWNELVSHHKSGIWSLFWPDIPETGRGLMPSFWYDFVFEVARWRMSACPIDFYQFELDSQYRVAYAQSRNTAASDIWKITDPPVAWELCVRRFASASIYAIELLVEWGETGICPFLCRANDSRNVNVSDQDSLVIEDRSGIDLSNDGKELVLIGQVNTQAGLADQLFRELTKHDYGIDGEIEFKSLEGHPTGRKIYLQLKSGNSFIRHRKSDGHDVFDVKNPAHLTYWVSQPVDVYLVILEFTDNPNEPRVQWMNVTRYLDERKNKDCLQIEFSGEPFDVTSILRVRDKELAIRPV